MKTWCVYKHTAPNGKVYIGITSRKPEERWNGGNGYSHNKHFTSAIRLYGWENIKHEILISGLSKEEACLEEKRLIIKYNSFNRKFGYNETLGGESGKKHTDTTKSILSEIQKRNWKNEAYRINSIIKHTGHRHSEETKRKMSISHRAENLSEETRKKLSAANKSRRYPGRPGHPQTDESKEKISLSKRGKHFGGVGKPPREVICLSTGEKFKSVKEASEIKGISRNSIYDCCNGKKKSVFGLTWQFAS